MLGGEKIEGIYSGGKGGILARFLSVMGIKRNGVFRGGRGGGFSKERYRRPRQRRRESGFAYL